MKKENKKERVVSMPIGEYRKLKRSRDSLLKAKNHIKIAWQAVSNVKELEKVK